MQIGKNLKLIAILVIIILLGLLVVSATAETISQYRQRCRTWQTSQNNEAEGPYSDWDCHEEQPRSCWRQWSSRGCYRT